jgi:hypothetical protein
MVRTEKSRQRVASGEMSDTKRFCQRLSSGIFKSDLRTVQETMHMARALVDQMKQMGSEYDLCRKYGEEGDFVVAVAFLTPDLSVLNTWPFNPGKEAEMQVALSGPGRCSIPVGLVFDVKGKDGKVVRGARPFLNTPLVRMALEKRLASDEVGIQ